VYSQALEEPEERTFVPRPLAPREAGSPEREMPRLSPRLPAVLDLGCRCVYLHILCVGEKKANPTTLADYYFESYLK